MFQTVFFSFYFSGLMVRVFLRALVLIRLAYTGLRLGQLWLVLCRNTSAGAVSSG